MQDKILDFLEKMTNRQNKLWLEACQFSTLMLKALECSGQDLEMLYDYKAIITIQTSFGKVLYEVCNVAAHGYGGGDDWKKVFMLTKITRNEGFTGRVGAAEMGGGTSHVMVLDSDFNDEVLEALENGQFEIHENGH